MKVGEYYKCIRHNPSENTGPAEVSIMFLNYDPKEDIECYAIISPTKRHALKDKVSFSNWLLEEKNYEILFDSSKKRVYSNKDDSTKRVMCDKKTVYVVNESRETNAVRMVYLYKNYNVMNPIYMEYDVAKFRFLGKPVPDTE